MPRTYEQMPELPAVIDDPMVQEFMSHFYATSNHSSDHEGFADIFAADGEYGMNDRIAKGRDEIIKMRRGLWSHVPERDHTPLQIFTHGHDQLQLMARGYVKYGHHMGHATETEWACYYQLEKDDKGELKMKKVHIIVVSNTFLGGLSEEKDHGSEVDIGVT